MLWITAPTISKFLLPSLPILIFRLDISHSKTFSYSFGERTMGLETEKNMQNLFPFEHLFI